MERVYLYDVTLRDGAQTQGVDFSATDKKRIARILDELGVDYIEGGWPGANPTDDAFFANPPEFKTSKLAAFGMTRRAGRSADNDQGFNSFFNHDAVKVATMVGKSWKHQVKIALKIEGDENLRMISDSIAYAKDRLPEVMFDAEHFFDGFKSDPDYALSTLKVAYEAGARWMVLCDTNGGSLPHEIERIVSEVILSGIPGDHLGIHCHNDTDAAVANSLAAVRAGVRQVQGTINGLGERCGNANLISIIPNLVLKMGFDTGIPREKLKDLVAVSRMLDDVLDRNPDRHAPYVGYSAFAHKGGLHASAVIKDPTCYEHIDPILVGNTRQIVVSDQAGRSNLLLRMAEMGLDLSQIKRESILQVLEGMSVGFDPRDVTDIVDLIKRLEHQGYTYDQATASFELLIRRVLGQVPQYFVLERYRVIDERRRNAKGEWVTLSEATIKIVVNGKAYFEVGEGNGPVNAFDLALRKVLISAYPSLEKFNLSDYRVRIVESTAGTEAPTRVTIESTNGATRWTTMGVHFNVLEASLEALQDSITYMLYCSGSQPQ